jgi:hypothetical protein
MTPFIRKGAFEFSSDPIGPIVLPRPARWSELKRAVESRAREILERALQKALSSSTGRQNAERLLTDLRRAYIALHAIIVARHCTAPDLASGG